MTQTEFEQLTPMLDKVRCVDAIDGKVYEFTYAGKVGNWTTGGDWLLLMDDRVKTVVEHKDFLSDFEVVS